jgi:flotillin
VASGGVAEQITSAALNYRANAPMIDSMLQELGLVNKESGTLDDLITGKHSLIDEAKSVVQQSNIKTNSQLNGHQISAE